MGGADTERSSSSEDESLRTTGFLLDPDRNEERGNRGSGGTLVGPADFDCIGELELPVLEAVV